MRKEIWIAVLCAACSSSSGGSTPETSAGGSTSAGSGNACYTSTLNDCTVFNPKLYAPGKIKDQCDARGGTLLDACPTASLDGCCVFNDPSTAVLLEDCAYNEPQGQMPPLEMSCPTSGKWQTTP